MIIHKFQVGLTGGETVEPIIRFTGFDNHRDFLKEDVYRVLKASGFKFIEMSYIGPLYIPEMCHIDHHFESQSAKVIFSQDECWQFDFILANDQPSVIEKIATLLDGDRKFKLLGE